MLHECESDLIDRRRIKKPYSIEVKRIDELYDAQPELKRPGFLSRILGVDNEVIERMHYSWKVRNYIFQETREKKIEAKWTARDRFLNEYYTGIYLDHPPIKTLGCRGDYGFTGEENICRNL